MVSRPIAPLPRAHAGDAPPETCCPARPSPACPHPVARICFPPGTRFQAAQNNTIAGRHAEADTQSATFPRRLRGSRATVSTPPSLHEPTERSPGSPQHQFRPNGASRLQTAAVGMPDVDKKGKATCRRAGVKVGEANACATCSGYNGDRGDVRGSRGRARFEAHFPPAVWRLERSTNMFSHLREEGSASGRNEQRKGTPMRHINPPPLCSGVPSIAYWRYRGPKWFESGLANLRSVVRSPGESSPAGKDAAALPRLRAPRWCLRKRQQALSSCALRLAAPAQGAWDAILWSQVELRSDPARHGFGTLKPPIRANF